MGVYLFREPLLGVCGVLSQYMALGTREEEPSAGRSQVKRLRVFKWSR